MNNRYREEEKEEKLDETNSESNEDVVEDCEKETESSKCDNTEFDKLIEENKKLKEQYLRTLADTENFRKRVEEERARERKYGSQRILEKLVRSLDIFDKALNIKTDDQVLKNFLIGFEMINNNLKQILEEEGVKKMKTVGEIFDPRLHHAVETEYVEDKKENIILEELQSGYTFKDRVLIPALVKVNKKENNNKDNNNKEE